MYAKTIVLITADDTVSSAENSQCVSSTEENDYTT